MNARIRLPLAVLSTAALIALGGAAGAQSVRWDLSMEDQPTSLPGIGATAFAADLLERSGGAIAVTVHHSASLGMKNKDHLTAVADGVLPLAQSLAGTFSGDEPVFLLSSLPFVTRDVNEAEHLLEVARPTYEEALARHNQIYLYASPFPPSGIWAKKAITSVEDILPLKLRTFDAIGSSVVRALGATPVQISFSDIIPQLSTNNIDSVLTSADGGRSLKFWEFMPYFNNIGYAFPINITALNLDAFNGLSPELQAAVLDAAKAAEARDWQAVRDWAAGSNASLQENGVTIVSEFDAAIYEALIAAAGPVIEDWKAKVPAGAGILAAFEDARAAADE